MFWFFACDNKSFAQTKNSFVGMCVPGSPAFINYDNTYIVYWVTCSISQNPIILLNSSSPYHPRLSKSPMWIVMRCYEMSWAIMNSHEFSKIVINCYELSWIVINHHKLSWILTYVHMYIKHKYTSRPIYKYTSAGRAYWCEKNPPPFQS